MEQNGRFCSDGELLLIIPDGWVWYFVLEVFSQQEGMYMRICGNREGKDVYILLYLCETIFRERWILYNPHLTFILNKGLYYIRKLRNV
jgi:hypothetical protein